MRTYPDFVPNLIGGAYETAASGEQIEVFNPHSGEVIGRVARSRREDVSRAIASARAAQPGWASTPGVVRGEILHAIASEIEAHREELAYLVALEAGKREDDALAEVRAAVQCARFFAGEGQRLFGRTTTSGKPNRFAMTVRQPCGVAGLIIAANTPAPNFAWKVFPALICGNSIVLKPSEHTPASAWYMAKLAYQAKTALKDVLPPGVLNLVHGHGPEAGQPIVEDEGTDVVSFTGSAATGKAIGALAGSMLKKLSLELGGKNALIICDDADMRNAVDCAVSSAFSNAGQRCAAASRILVSEKIYPSFIEDFVQATHNIKLGVEIDCKVGPVISNNQLQNMCAAVAAAAGTGANIITGGSRDISPALKGGFYMQPTILEDVGPGQDLWDTELFGPVALVHSVSDFQQAVELANRSRYGLTASIHTQDINKALAFVQMIHTGVAVINGGTHGSEPHMPFGGVKNSGNGSREPGTEALDVYSELQDVYINVTPP